MPAELLNGDGSVNQGSAGGGPSYWQYTLAGTGRETYVPKFFYFGSRYQQVEVMPASAGGPLPTVEALSTTMVHANSAVAGRFNSSNELFNRTWQLVRYAQRSNMMSVMTDCPHREKLGWLEEDYLNGPALRYNFDMAPLFAKVMNDMADSQLEDGMVPGVAPEYTKFGEGDANPFRSSPEWGSAFVQVAWQQYQFNGDLGLLRRHYEGMKRYVAYLTSKSDGHIIDFGLGDWFDIGPGEPGFGKLTPRALTGTATYFANAQILATTAGLLGNKADAEKYRKLMEEIRVAFNAKFFNEAAKSYATGSQTSNAMALALGLVAPQHKVAVLDAIVKDVQGRGNALTSGDVGYRYLLRALADGGRSDVIFAMNNQSDKPGYGYQLKRGATSLTEAWDANPGPSQNHFMLGQINEWFYHDLAGIQAAGPGFAEIAIRPAFLPDIQRVNATFVSPYGEIGSHWERKNSRLSLAVTVPGNTSAVVYLPVKSVSGVTEGGKALRDVAGVRVLGVKDGVAVLRVGSGRYLFGVN
ncbi:hypothetical protein EON80_04165 [bacterium]|nr:MAG: hypothetical protein EON80_04165 [bacterium]